MEYSETSSIVDSKHDLVRDDDSIVAEDRIEDESFPMSDKFDSEGEARVKDHEYRVESLEYDTEKSEASLYKIKEREDILDTDDRDDIKVAEKDEEESLGTEAPASFYIGESIDNIITKSATEKRTEFAFDNEGYTTTQESTQEPLIESTELQNISPNEKSEIILHKIPSQSDFVADEINLDSSSEQLRLKQSANEPDDDLIQPTQQTTKVVHSPIEPHKAIIETDELVSFVPEQPEHIYIPSQKKESEKYDEISRSDFDSYKKSTKELVSDFDLPEPQKAKVVHSPVESYKTVVQLEQLISMEPEAFDQPQKASIIHSPVQSFKSSTQFEQSVTIVSDKSEERHQAELTHTTTHPFTSVTERTEDVIMTDDWPTATTAAIVHLPIQPYKSATEFEHPTSISHETIEPLQRASLIHSPIEDFKSAKEVEQVYSIQSNLPPHSQAHSESSQFFKEATSESSPKTLTDDMTFEFDIDTLPKRALVLHSPVESQNVLKAEKKFTSARESDYDDNPDFPASEASLDDITSSPKPETSGSSNEDSINKLKVVHRDHKTKITPASRWSVTDPDNCSSSGSHYDSFEKTDSRPVSSDVENLYTSYGNSSDYQTAHDASFLHGVGSTEYVTAASTLDHSGKTISSHESMKSLDSDSSGQLGSMDASEVSEASETLVPSTMDFDLPTDTQSRDFEFDLDENEKRLASLEACSGILLEELNEDHIDNISSNMKRSQEMIFQPDAKVLEPVQSVDLVEMAAPIEIVSQTSNEADRAQPSAFSYEDTKLATSLEEGSVLSVSFSSTSNVDTIVENVHDDMASSFGSSLIGSYEVQSILRDDITSTSFDENHGQIDSLIMTSSFVRDDDVHSVNTQITTTSEASSEATTVIEGGRRGKGHRRNDSTSFINTLDLKAASESDDNSLEEEMVIHDVEEEDNSDSDYDRYETEYSRSFRQPTKQKKKAKLEKAEPKEIERKKSVPSIETIVEDVNAEIEIDYHEERPPSQNMQDYSNIPDIMITDDPTKYVEGDDEDDFLSREIGAVDTEPPKPIKPTVGKAKEPEPSIRYAKEAEIKISDEQYEELIERQYQTKLAEQTKKEYTDERIGGDSPTSDSFEMVDVEQPDISEEFVIIEEVAKEAHELMTEGKSVCIQKIKYEKKHDEEVEKITVRSAPAATNEGSRILQGRHDMAFEFEESPPNADGIDPNGLDSSRKWVEMELAEQAQNLRYPYDLDRGVLEDIKEEDTDFEVGSSRLSSFKESFSGTPDYEALTGRKYYPSKDADAMSINSLQEFESLEQAISLENRRYHQGSQDSLSNGSFPRKYNLARSAQGDDISLASLKEFEGLENACLEAHLTEIKAKEEHALLLSRSDESNKSNNSDQNGKTITKVTEMTGADGKTVTKVTEVTTTVVTRAAPIQITEERIVTGFQSQPVVRTVEYRARQKFDEIDDDLSSANLMEVSTDSLELGPKHLKHSGQSKETSHHGSSDSLEISKSADIMTSSIDSIEISKDGAATTKSSKSDADSIEQLLAGREAGKRDSIDSIDMQYALLDQATKGDRDSMDGSSTFYSVQTTMTSSGNQIITSTTSAASSSGYGGGISKDISSDSLNLNQSEKELLLTSTESLENTSSTNATYQNETDSQMSSSVTSCESNTLMDTLGSHGERYQEEFDDGFGTRTTTTTTVYRTVRPNDQQQ